LIFCLNDVSIDESGVLKSFTTLMSGHICPIMSSSVYFMKLGTLMFVAYILRIVISSGWVVPFFKYVMTF
jgi:hypothetical protein